jgi:hypothetical protein
MAHLLIAEDAVTIDMSRGEKLEAAHRNQAFPRNAISSVRAVPDCIAEVHGMKGAGAEVHGMKGAGTELPGIRVGSFHDDGRVTFAVCHGPCIAQRPPHETSEYLPCDGRGEVVAPGGEPSMTALVSPYGWRRGA